MSTDFEAPFLLGPEPGPEANRAGQVRIVIEQAMVSVEPMDEGDSLEVLVPGQLTLGTLSDARLRVRLPIEVRVTTAEGRVAAEAPVFGEFGFGDNLSDAVNDLQRTLVELYFELKENAEALGPDMATTWVRLQASVSPRG